MIQKYLQKKLIFLKKHYYVEIVNTLITILFANKIETSLQEMKSIVKMKMQLSQIIAKVMLKLNVMEKYVN